MSGLQNVRSSKRSFAKKHPYILCTCGWWKSAGSVAAMFAGKVMAVFYSQACRLGNSNTFCFISISNLKTGRFETRRQSGVRFTAHLAIECIIGKYCTKWRPCVKGLSRDGGRAEFSKKPLRLSL